MIAYLKAKLALFLVLIVLVPLLIGGFYYYLTAMKVVQGNLNVNKITSESRIYSHSVFSDFYFRATKYDDKGERIAMYGEVIPVETRIGFDFKESKLRLQHRSTDSMVLNDMNSHDIRSIKVLRDFARTFGEIVATQDGYYFDKALDGILDMNKSLYGEDLKLELPEVVSFYEPLVNLPIANLKLQPYKLDAITSNLKTVSIAPLDDWQPNLVEFHFGENDSIYLQYAGRFQGDAVDQLRDSLKKSAILVDSVKFHNNSLSRLSFSIKSLDTGASENQIDAYMMDLNGYLYLLRFRAFNEQSFDRYLPDFLKIAYSIYFEDIQGFNNWFVSKQAEAEENYATYIKNLKAIKDLEKELLDVGLLQHFGLQTHEQPIYEYKIVNQPWWHIGSRNSQNLVRFDEAFNNFYEIYGRYPSQNELEQELADRKLLVEAMSKKFSDPSAERNSRRFWQSSSSLGIQDICDNLECVRSLKKADWKGSSND